MNAEMRKQALRRYLVFRVKVVEFFDIGALRQGVKTQQFSVPTPVGRVSSDFADSLRTVQLSWLALLIDKSNGGMHAIKLWSELFPGAQNIDTKSLGSHGAIVEYHSRFSR